MSGTVGRKLVIKRKDVGSFLRELRFVVLRDGIVGSKEDTG